MTLPHENSKFVVACGFTVCRKNRKRVIPKLGGFCRGEESALFSGKSDPSLFGRWLPIA
jgi:hypothetical protein